MKTYSLIILKPDALERGLAERILQKFIHNYFQIEMVGYKKVDKALIFDHYQHVIETVGESFKNKAVKSFVGMPMIPIILSQGSDHAIENARKLIGATDPSKADKDSVRGEFGIDSMEKALQENRICENLIHGCDSKDSFVREIKLWFDKETYEDYLSPEIQ